MTYDLLDCIGLSAMQSLLTQRVTDLQEVLNQRIEEAILQSSYIYDSSLMDSILREVHLPLTPSQLTLLCFALLC
jgi:hypothetical protein